MAWWSGAWERLRPSSSRDDGVARGSDAVSGRPASSPAAAQRLAEWTSAAPMPRAIDPHPLIAPLDPFTTALPTHRTPSFLAPLEHVVSPVGGGVVSGLATVAAESTAPVSPSFPPPAVTATPAVQRQTAHPDLVLSSHPNPIAPARVRAVTTSAVIVGAVGESLVRATDPGRPRELPVVARLVDASVDAALVSPAAGSVPRRPGSSAPAGSASTADHPVAVPPADRPVVSRSVAQRAVRLDDGPGVTALPGPTTSPTASPHKVSAPAGSSGDGLPTERTELRSSPSASRGPALTAAQRAVDRSAPLVPAPVPPPTAAAAPAAVQRTAVAGSMAPPPVPLPPRPTFGLGAPLVDVDSAPAAPAPVAVGFAAFPFGDAAVSGREMESDSRWAATVVARSAADAPGAGTVATGPSVGEGGRPSSAASTGRHLAVDPPVAAPADPVNTVQRVSVTGPAANGVSPLAAVPPPAATELPVVGIRQSTAAYPTVHPSGSAGIPTTSGSAGEAAVRAGVAQRAIDGSYVFAPPVPPSPVETTGRSTTRVSSPAGSTTAMPPTGAGTRPLRATAPASETGIGAGPVAQRLWGSDALNPGALVDRAREAVPTLPTPALPTPALPTPALPSSLPHLPAAPSLPDMPSLPAMPAVPTVPAMPTVPTMPAVPTVPAVPGLPALPGVPALPTLPALSDWLPSLPAVPSLPLPPTVPTLAAPTLPVLPSFPGVPSVPGESGWGRRGVPTGPTFPSLGTGPGTWPVGSGGGVDHPVPVTPLDRVINSTLAGPDSGVLGRVDHPLPGGPEREINSTAAPSGPAPSPESATPPAVAPAASGTPAGAAPAAAGAGATAARTAAAPGLDIDDLARRLIDPISARLRTELWLDRERAGLLTDL